MAICRITIDGRSASFAIGTTILNAARQIGIEVPTLCDDPRLEPSGACRLCLVEVAGAVKPVAACATPIADGMTIQTDSEAILSERRSVLEMLARHYPAAALEEAPDKEFHRHLRFAGVAAAAPSAPAESVDESHPYLRADMSRCIDCYRCVRICADLQGQDVWHLRDRGAEIVVHPAGPSLLASPCVACGACVDTCPTGALEDRSILRHGPATTWTRTVCPYCGVGCELDYGTRDGRMVASRPTQDGRANHGHACVKGRYAFDFVVARDRVTHPRVRGTLGWTDTTWPEAVATVADRLRRIVTRHGPDAVGILGSARATNEENYLTQKFARLAIGTNNVDCCARVCHAPSAAALKSMLGAGAATNSFDDIELARTILIAGANPTENHPVVGARIRQAGRRGAQLIVIDPRQTELVREARTIHLAPRPGTNIPLLNALAHVILAEALSDSRFLEDRVDGLSEYRAFVADWTPERAATICGVRAEDIRRAARRYATGGPAMIVHGLGITEHQQGTDGVSALVNLALLTGNIGRPGAGVNPLRGQNNVQGSAQMGCDPASLTGGVPIETGRAAFEAVWRAPLPRSKGLRLLDMIDAAVDGRLKALVVIGYDILLTNPHAERTRRALESLDLLVVQDLFWTETAGLAHLFLPAQSSFEKDGTFMNAERRVQRVRRVIAPVGASRSDAEIICDLAAALGQGPAFSYAGPEDVWNEIRDVWPDARGITYGRLDAGGLQWPCPTQSHPGSARLHEDRFPAGRAVLRCPDFRPTAELVGEEYPFLLTTGRTLYQFNAGTMTARTDNQQLRPTDTLDIAPVDARALGVADGDAVRVTSRIGSAVLPARITASVPGGILFATFHTADAYLNRVTSDARDPVGTPEYKVTAVRLERIREAMLSA
jgi:formate dehydrogenase major subunit